MLSHPTVHDIAREANADVNDVVRVMLKQAGVDRIVRDRVLVTMNSLNFPLTPDANKTAQRTLGIIAPHNASGEYMSAVLDAITRVTRSAKIGLKLNIQSSSDGDDLATFLSDPEIFGVLLVSPNDYEATLATCRHYTLPVATLSYQDEVDLSEILMVEIDNERSIINAVDYLVKLKHRRIGFITGYITHNDAIERFKGYKQGLKKHSIPYDEARIRYGDFLQESGYKAGISLLQQNIPPTAIIASSDLMAIGAIQAAQDLGVQVGTELSVIGFDDIALAREMKPALTTMAQPYMAMVQAAIEGLEKMAQGERLEDYQPRFETEFIIRHSTGQAR